jgi:hypothetical protein
LSLITGSFSTPAGENPTVAMIEAAYAHHQINARYLNCEVAPQGLADAVRGARAMGWAGFNCSILDIDFSTTYRADLPQNAVWIHPDGGTVPGNTMAQKQARSSRALRYDTERIAEMCAQLVVLVDSALESEPHTRSGYDARRLLRVAVTQMKWRAGASRDPALIAVVYDSLSRLKENSPELFAE